MSWSLCAVSRTHQLMTHLSVLGGMGVSVMQGEGAEDGAEVSQRRRENGGGVIQGGGGGVG